MTTDYVPPICPGADPGADWQEMGWCCRDCAALAHVAWCPNHDRPAEGNPPVMTTQQPENTPRATIDLPARISLWKHAGLLTEWLDDAHPRDTHETACRVMKLAEETGEAVNAYLGMTGQNPRKGTCATLDDLNGELGDVIIAALVALITVNRTTLDAYAALESHVSDRFAKLAAHVTGGPVEEWACECCGDLWFGTEPDHGLCPGCEDLPFT